MDQLFVELGFFTQSGSTQTLHLFAEALLKELQREPGSRREPTAQVIARLLRAMEGDPVVKLPSEFILLARVFSTLGGLFTHYDAHIDFNRYVLPHVASALAAAQQENP
jgi:ubiquinone biosynthesis protein